MPLTLRRLTKRFGGTTVLDSVDLAVRDGEVLCLLGPSGCGKTTTLRLIAGFLAPDGGEIALGDRLLSAAGRIVPSEQRQMSMLFQSFAVWPHMTVYENIAYGLRIRRQAKEEIGVRVREMLALVHLEGLERRYPGELSGGQQQRVALARALAVKPQVLLLDEPLSNLDATLREEMRFEIRRLHEQLRHTTLYVTHDIGEAIVTADRIAVMDRGRLVQVGVPEEVYAHPKTEFVARFIGKTNILVGAVAPGDWLELPEYDLRVGIALAGPATTPGPAKVSVRPTDISMASAPPAPPDPVVTILRGRVSQHVFLGETRDYIVQVGTRALLGLRVIRPAHEKFAVGDEVYLSIVRSSCHLLDAGEVAGRP